MPIRSIDSHPRRPYSYNQGTRARATQSDHTHLEVDITDLQNYTVQGHTHAVADIVDFAYGLIRRDGFVALPARQTIHFIGGNNIDIAAGDNPGSDETDVTISLALTGIDADTLDTFDAIDFPRKAEAATISGAWRFDNNIRLDGTATNAKRIIFDAADLSFDRAMGFHFSHGGEAFGLHRSIIQVTSGDFLWQTFATAWKTAYEINKASQVVDFKLRPTLNTSSLALLSEVGDATGPVSGLTDVAITAIAVGEILRWNGTTWINQTITQAGIAPIVHTHVEADITDLAHFYTKFRRDGFVAPTSRETLHLIGGIGITISNADDAINDETDITFDVALSFNDLSDSAITGPVSGEVIVGDGISWLNRTLAEANIAAADHNHDGVFEPVLGNPASDGFHLVSTVAGVRSWEIVPAASDAYSLFRRDGFVVLPARKTFHLIGGTGITIAASDDAGNDETDITINSVALSLDDLTDVNLAGTSDGFVLSFDLASGNWIDTTPAAAGLAGLAAANTFTATNTFPAITVTGNAKINSWSIPSPGPTTHVVETLWDGTRNRWIIVPKPSGVADFTSELFYNFSGGFWGIEGVSLEKTVGFFGTAPSAKKMVTGSRAGNAALASLLVVLANYGFITNSSTA